MTPRAMLAALALAAVAAKVGADYGPDKRHIGVLARTGQLPYQTESKRYVAALARNGDLPFFARREWNKKFGPRSLMEYEKRYVGSLLRNGGSYYGKRSSSDAVDDLIEDLVESAEELRRLRDDDSDDKRSLAALARANALPDDGKRSVEALARAGYLPFLLDEQGDPINDSDDTEISKRNIATLARDGLISPHGPVYEGKRGIGSLARNGLLPPHKRADDTVDFDSLIRELYEEGPNEERRSVSSLARTASLPYGKRNIGSLARSGGFSNIRYITSKKNSHDNSIYQEDKRSLASIMRGRSKRYIGALARSHGLPFSQSKKNIFDSAYGKDQDSFPESYSSAAHLFSALHSDDLDDMSKRYVAALLRNGPLPPGIDEDNMAEESGNAAADIDGVGSAGEEEKRHLGSLAAKGGFAVAKKSSDGDASTNNSRPKRQAVLLPSFPATDEYPMPVFQNSEMLNYDDFAELVSGGAAPDKRFLGADPYEKRHIGALARLGWLPTIRARSGKRSEFRAHPPDGTLEDEGAGARAAAPPLPAPLKTLLRRLVSRPRFF